MIELGKIQELMIMKKVEFGVYLASKDRSGAEGTVLLPVKQVPPSSAIGDVISVFVYKDSKDRMIATTNTPKMTLGELAECRVVQVGKVGAFLEWGLEKDLLLPFREQTRRVQEGDTCLAALYIDKSSRLCATMNVYPYLRNDSPYQAGDRIQGRVYEISKEFGAFVAVDNRYSGLIPVKEMYGDIQIGDNVSARITAVKPDGKLDLSIREKAYLQIGSDAQKIMDILDKYQGEMPFTDKTDPEVIRGTFQMSKNEFKRAVGNLYRERKITITETSIKSNDK